MNIIHDHIKNLLFGINLDNIIFEPLDTIILKERGSSCPHNTNQTSDWYSYQTDGIYIDHLNIDELKTIIHEDDDCINTSISIKFANASYAIQYQQFSPTLIYIDENRFNANSMKDLRKIIDDIFLEQEKQKGNNE